MSCFLIAEHNKTRLSFAYRSKEIDMVFMQASTVIIFDRKSIFLPAHFKTVWEIRIPSAVIANRCQKHVSSARITFYLI